MTGSIVVTGGSSGLGMALSRELATRGESVIAVGRNREKLTELSADPSLNKRVTSMHCDLSSGAAVRSLIDSVLEKHNVKALVNVAGAPAFGPLVEVSESSLEEAIKSNVNTVVLITSGLVSHLIQQERALLVTVMSTTALKGRSQESLYAACKWAVRGFVESVKEELKDSTVKIIEVYPGGMNTPFWNRQGALSPNVSAFLDPAEVAIQIADSMRHAETTGYVSSMTIDRG